MKQWSRLLLLIGLISLVCTIGLWSAPVKIIYYTWDMPENHAMVDAFNAAQKDVVIDPQYLVTGEYEAKISTLLAGGIEMDAWMQKRQTDTFAHYANGYIQPLDDLIKKSGKNLSYISNYIDSLKVDDKVIGIPFRGASYFTFYNKKIFENAGIQTPDKYVEKGQWTWSKFIEVSKKLASGDGKVYGGCFYTWGSSQIVPTYQTGMQFITPDGKIDVNDSFLQSFKMRKELEQSKAIWGLTDMKITKTHYSKAFFDGNVGMLIIGEWFPATMMTGSTNNLLIGYTWKDWGLTRIPCDVKTYTTYGNPTYNVINAKSKNKDAAFKFLTWIGGSDGAKVVAKTGNYPAYGDSSVAALFKANIPDAGSLKYYTEKRKVAPQLLTKYGSKIEPLIASMMEEYLGKDISDQDLVNNLKAKLDEIVKTTD
jgi:multiple sugar transport system substrate-binding protein